VLSDETVLNQALLLSPVSPRDVPLALFPPVSQPPYSIKAALYHHPPPAIGRSTTYCSLQSYLANYRDNLFTQKRSSNISSRAALQNQFHLNQCYSTIFLLLREEEKEEERIQFLNHNYSYP